MGKWKAVEGRDHPECGGKRFWSVSDVDGKKLIFITRDEEIANLIVRDHNAHEALVELVREYREEMDDRDQMWTIKRIDAVLAQAEGRE